MSATTVMDTSRANATASELQAERHRREMLRNKNVELESMDSARDTHRRRVDASEAHKHQLLNEMRSVRDMMDQRKLHAKASGSNNKGVSDRALARAGKLACDASFESQRWHINADSVASVAATAAGTEKASLAATQEANMERIYKAQSSDVARVDLGHILVTETAKACNEDGQRRAEQRDTQEKFAEQLQQQNSNRAESVRYHAGMQVKCAIDKASKDQMSAVNAIQKSREDAVTSVENARLEMARKRAAVMAQIENERICANQATKMGNTLRQQAHEHHEEETARVQSTLCFVEGQAATKIANFDAELEETKERNDIWLDHEARSRDRAQHRSEKEAILARSRVDAAKVKLAELQAQCAAYIRDLQDQHEEAKKVDSAKVQEAQNRTADLARYCSKTLAECEEYCAALVAKTEHHASEAKARLEDRVSEIGDLSEKRIQMMREQARDRRERSERQLQQLQEHVAYIQAQCEERVREEARTASQKVDIARDRNSAEVGRAEQRLAEMSAKRDAARAQFDFVMGRLHGSLGEVRRYGLTHIVDILDPPPPAEPVPVNDTGPQEELPLPTVEEAPVTDNTAKQSDEEPVLAVEETSAVGAAMEEARDTQLKPPGSSGTGLMATGSTMLPEDMGATAESQPGAAGATMGGEPIPEVAEPAAVETNA